VAGTPDEQHRVNEEILDALLQGGEGAVPKGAPPQLREIITRGDDEFPAPVVAKVYEDAGVHTIYDVETREPSLTGRNMLPAQLRKLSSDGKRMFTIHRPDQPPARGAHKCLLHPDVRKPEYDTWGLPRCRKANLTSPLQVELHMQHRHKTEWASIKREQERLERDEQMQLQRQIAAAAIARTGEESTKKKAG